MTAHEKFCGQLRPCLVLTHIAPLTHTLRILLQKKATHTYMIRQNGRASFSNTGSFWIEPAAFAPVLKLFMFNCGCEWCCCRDGERFFYLSKWSWITPANHCILASFSTYMLITLFHPGSSLPPYIAIAILTPSLSTTLYPSPPPGAEPSEEAVKSFSLSKAHNTVCAPLFSLFRFPRLFSFIHRQEEQRLVVSFEFYLKCLKATGSFTIFIAF